MSVLDAYAAERGRMTGWLVNRGTPPEDAEEIVQDAWVRVWRAERFGKDVSTAYVWRALKTIAIDRWRSARLRDRIAGTGDPASPDWTGASADRLTLERWLADLTDKQRATVRLRCEGLSDDETGEAIGVAASGVRKLRCRALAQLRKRASREAA